MNDSRVLLEVKARVEDLEFVKRKLTELNAKYVGKFQQTDTYFEVPNGRLKIREIAGYSPAQFIYYEREDVKESKKSRAFILKIDQPASFKAAIKKILKVKAIVQKTREIYEFKGTKIHLDTVKGLGRFVELEKLTEENKSPTRFDRQTLDEILEILQISPTSFEKFSYSELIKNKESPQK